jgi:hypothetical protein
MATRNWLRPTSLLLALSLLAGGCGDRGGITSPSTYGLPALTTTAVTSITLSTATSGGRVTSGGGTAVVARGVCWSAGPSFTIDNALGRTTDGADVGSYASIMTGLTPNTGYYVRAYATNSTGTGYGDLKSFTTITSVPALTTSPVSSITLTSAATGGTISSENGAPVTSRGVCYSTSANPTIAAGSTVDGAGAGSFTSNITGLTLRTVYHVRAYATNSQGTGYGNDVTFTTKGDAPRASTRAATNMRNVAAALHGSIDPCYLSTVVTFEYGLTTTYGQSVTAIESPVTGATHSGMFGPADTSVSAVATGLTVFQTYHFRVKAVNSLGTTYGNDMTFATLYQLGDTACGGAICYLDSTGRHGYAFTVADLDTMVAWYNGTYMVTGANGTAVGTGQANTTAIVTAQRSGHYAASICDELDQGGYSDWFLPSQGELDLIYAVPAAVSSGVSRWTPYWTSTECGSNTAWSIDLPNGDPTHYCFDKAAVSIGYTFWIHVRAVRVF